ncbi:unnamed protein product [Rotaria sp. Silwood1]|nr:unnamed protein product [Rotaria sp. Silwood1]
MDKLNKSLEFLKLLSATTSETLIINMKTLFTTCDENNYDNLKEANLTRIQVELHRIIKHYPNVGSKALKGYFYHMA